MRHVYIMAMHGLIFFRRKVSISFINGFAAPRYSPLYKSLTSDAVMARL